jgi:hypothetical protein
VQSPSFFSPFFFVFLAKKRLYQCCGTTASSIRVFCFFFPPFYSVDVSSNFCEPISKTCQFRRLCELKRGKIGEASLAKVLVCWNCRRFNRHILVRQKNMGVDLFVVLPKMLLHSSLQVGTFDPTKKKKKKKKVRIQDDEETGENIEKVTEKVETLAGNKEDLLKRFTI